VDQYRQPEQHADAHDLHFAQGARYSPALGPFDTVPLADVTKDRSLLAVNEHYFRVDGVRTKGSMCSRGRHLRSCTKTSVVSFPSPGTKFHASESKATKRPLDEVDGS